RERQEGAKVDGNGYEAGDEKKSRASFLHQRASLIFRDNTGDGSCSRHAEGQSNAAMLDMLLQALDPDVGLKLR
ncbi:hypothetical protein BaRGS_00021006, partial [Batillaria attramentaria]